ncbi:MAG TPA: NAD-dependent epimerase/dehydratase family protein [Hyphomicrobiaceae bacterium]|jgi:nucleoside-diphosphate-sugar epimerase|nr:NAD-dependent epimerase/dehydratase family protein [Hyphomicrobiaceae bacterium]
MHALVLGGTGSAGRVLIQQLLDGAPPVEVSVVSRTATSLPGASRVIAGHYGDLAPSPEFRQWLARVDVIVHLADGLSVLQQPRFAADTALAGGLLAASERLAVAACAARVPRLVYVSSIKALCDEDDARILAETCLPRGSGLYGRSKLRLEETLARVLAGSPTRLAVVRNPAMYGPGKAGSVHRLLRLADTALPLPLGGLVNRRSLLAVANFASALTAMVRAGPHAAAGTFHVHDGEVLSTTAIVATMRAALGRPRRLFAIGRAAAAAMHIPPLAPVARRLYGSLEVSDARFRRAFDWTPAVETNVALAEMAAAHAARLDPDSIRATAFRHG